MRAEVKWTNLSRRQIAKRMAESGTPVSRDVVSQLLRKHGYRRRKALKKKTMGQHRDRNAQFEKIARLKKRYLKAGLPVISIDTKKKELLGNFHRAGATYTEQTVETFDHDFPSWASGQGIPYGIYDEAHNDGYVVIGTSHETPDFAAAAIRCWWRTVGRSRYPEAKFSIHMVREWKEAGSFVGAPKSPVVVTAPVNGKPTQLDITQDMRQACESILPPMVDSMLDLLSRVQPEFQEKVRNNIVLSGGTGLVRGLGPRLEAELQVVGGGKVRVVKDPIFVGSDGGLAIAIDAPDSDWERLSAA